MLKHTKFLTALASGVAVAGLVVSTPVEAKVEGDTIILGAALSFTGKYSTNGKHTKNGYDLAVTTVNKMGGVNVGGKNYKIKVQYYDDESTPARGAQLVERLVKQDGIKFMLGPYSSGMTKAMAPVTEKYGVPMVEGNGASRSLFNKGYKYLFAVLSTSEQYLAESINLAAENADKVGKKPGDLKVALAMENDPFSQDIRAGVLEDAKRHGMTVVIDDKLPKELNDMTATLTKVKALKPDILVVSGHSKGAALAIRQTTELKVDVPMLAMTHCEAAKVHEKFKANADYTLCATQWAESMSYKDKWFGSAKQFGDKFRSVYTDYGVVPYQAAESAASVLVWVDALERAGSFDSAKVRDALSATEMQTFYGNIKFAPTGQNIAKPMALRQIIKGEYKVVAPSKWAEQPVVFPRPTWSER